MNEEIFVNLFAAFLFIFPFVWLIADKFFGNSCNCGASAELMFGIYSEHSPSCRSLKAKRK